MPDAHGGRVGPTEAVDRYSAMTQFFSWWAALFGRRYFSRFALEPEDCKALGDLEERGAVVYVMRYGSRLDYFLFNWLFLASGLRLSSAANGIRFYYYRPPLEALRLGFQRLVERMRWGTAGRRDRQRKRLRILAREGASLFLFLRTDKIPSQLVPRRWALRTGRSETDYLREIVDACFEGDEVVSLVPLALFWRRGAKPARPFLDLFYGGPERPRSFVKVLSFLFNYRNLAVRVGTPIDLRGFIDRHRSEGRERVVKQVRRSLLIFLRREEKPVVGGALRTIQRVHDAVLADPDVRDAIAVESTRAGRSALAIRERASRYVRKIAANPSPTTLALMSAIVQWLMGRLFTRFDVHGLDRVIDAAKLHPLIVVPSHRSHFDYVILSWLFYQRHVVPPHVAAGENLSFWPLGAVFRRGGAFFLRRRFEGDALYTAVFRAYVQLLIKDGITQEFFIEGTRSRTGKTLQPRLGLLRMILDAYARGARRELFIVPVGFAYERLVEEGSISEERSGRTKRKENLWALLRARSVLRYRFGTVTVRFGEPIPVSASLVRASAQRAESEVADVRRATSALGVEICREINAQITAQPSAVAAAALLPGPGEAVRIQLLRERVLMTVEMLRWLRVPIAETLSRLVSSGRVESVAEPLVQADRVQREPSPRGDLLRLEASARRTLDYYRAALTPALAWPGVLALALRAEGEPGAVLQRASLWLDLLELEYFPLAGSAREERLDDLIQWQEERGWITRVGEELRVTPAGQPWQVFWAAQIQPVLETYAAVFDATAECGGESVRAELVRSARALHSERLALGEARYAEGDCPVASANAIDWLLRSDILTEADAARRALAPGSSWGQLAQRVELLATAGSTR